MALFNRLFELALIAIGVFVCVTSLSFPSPYYAFSLGLLMAIGSLVLLISGIYRRPANKQETVRKKFGKSEMNIIKTITATLLYVSFIQTLGFIIASLIFMVALMWLLNYRSWIRITAISLPFVLVIYLFFTRIIHVSLPTGPLPF